MLKRDIDMICHNMWVSFHWQSNHNKTDALHPLMWLSLSS